MRDAGSRCSGRRWDPGRGRRRRQRLDRSQRGACDRRRRTRDLRAASRLRVRLHGRLRRRPRQVHRHGRRRPHVRLQRDPALRARARQGRRARHGRPDGQHQARRDAVAAPVRRQPGPQRDPQRLLQDRHQRRPLRHARAAPGRAAAAGPAHHRDGVRVGDGHPGGQGTAAHRRVLDRLPPARRRVQAQHVAGRLAASALPARALARRTCSSRPGWSSASSACS